MQGANNADRLAWTAVATGVLLCLFCPVLAAAHGLEGGDAAFVRNASGPQIAGFAYLGAKHMVTGLDHLLYLAGVLFLLDRAKQVALQASLFSLGHSITLIMGVIGEVRVDVYLVDAVIGLSVVYKAFDNLGGFRALLGAQPDAGLAVFGFGLIHGLGLATKLQELGPSKHGLLANMLAFNGGVEVGQLLAMSVLLSVLLIWRRRPGFAGHAIVANTLLMSAGLCLIGWQLLAWLLAGGEA